LAPGLCVLSPRLGFRGVGVGFAELLVLTGDSACWLDDELPHVRRAVTVSPESPSALAVPGS
jgi:hypothetical protein